MVANTVARILPLLGLMDDEVVVQCLMEEALEWDAAMTPLVTC